MTNVNRKDQIINALSAVKIVSILFSGFVVINVISESAYSYSSQTLFFRDILLAFVLTIALAVFYYIWSFLLIKKLPDKFLTAVDLFDTLFLLLLFLFVICISGWQTSHFKVLLLVIILSLTILRGSRPGMALCAVCSAGIILLHVFTPYPDAVYSFLGDDLSYIFIFFFTSWILGHYVKLGNEHIGELEERANIDGLTGLYNHRYFYDRLMDIMTDCRAGKCTLILLLLDIDYFKEYNDENGHLSGDQILRDVSLTMRNHLPDSAILARYGGDEFAAILVDIPEEAAYKSAENVRKSVEDLQRTTDGPLSSPRLTISIGIAKYNENIHNDIELFKCADDALYRAKLFKKNRVEIYSSILDMIQMDMGKEDIDLVTSLHALINIVNAKDRYTYGHVERVVMYAKALGTKLALSDVNKRELVLAAYMHDIGKVNLSEQVLNKKLPLEDDEWDQVKEHSINGAHILREVSVLADIAPLVLSHHERFDGQGYPDHLKGDEIPYLSRVLAVVDSFDAMTFDRPYKVGMTYEKAVAELKANKGTQFDPEIADTFIKIIEEASKENGTNLTELLTSPKGEAKK